MAKIPPHVRAKPPTYRAPGVTVWYQPANTRRDIPRDTGAPQRGAMDDLLLSEQIQKPVLEAAADMEADARELAVSQGVGGSGSYLSSFEHKVGDVVVINDGSFSNPRVSAEVSNEAATAAAVEFGNARVGEGKRILGQIADRYDNPKGGA